MPNHGVTWDGTEDRIVLAGNRLRLVFTRTADRWVHFIELDRNEGSANNEPVWTPLVHSLETGADRAEESSIVSPVYQEIQPHNLEGREGSALCVLLTGRHFDHQFSAALSFAIDPERPGDLIVDWDVADRCRAPISYLAATYHTPFGSGDLADADANTIRWNGGLPANASIEFHAGPPEHVALAEAGRNGTRVQAVARVEAGVFTHRLRYRWRWSPGTELAS